MSDLIDRDALKDFAYINKGNFNTVEGIREWIDNAPTVSDRTEEVLSLQNTIAKLVEGIDENARPRFNRGELEKALNYWYEHLERHNEEQNEAAWCAINAIRYCIENSSAYQE